MGLQKVDTFKRIGLFIAILFTLFLLSCRTSKNEVVKDKVRIEVEKIQINKIDSVSDVIKNNNILESDSISWNNFFKDYTINYNGVSNEDSFEVVITDQGFRFQGKGNAVLKKQISKSDSVTTKKITEVINEFVNINSNSENKIKLDSISKIKEVQKENTSKGFNFNFTIVIIIVVIVLIYFIYRYYLRKSKIIS